MKTIEEKAKAYDEVLKKVKDLISRCKNDTDRRTMIYRVEDIESILPELAESEDERIRKELLTFFRESMHGGHILTNKEYDSWIAWLEKQGQKDILEDAILDGNEDGLIAETIRYKHEKQSKQKLDKVEPKFKVGDWIINPRTGLIKHIKNVLLCDDNGNYEFESSSMSIDSVDNSFRLWTIQDAKNGDVLINWNNTTFIFKTIEDETVKFHIAYNEKWDTIKTPSTKLSHLGFPEPQFEFHPATKEQRTELFLKMHEAGYEWDVEKRELKKINSYCQENCKGFQETGKCFADGECKAKKEAEQKSVTWNEEDEDHVNSLLKRLKGLCRKEFTTTRFAVNEDENWLKSLKGRVPSKQEWSEEDSYYRNHIIQIIEEINNAPLKRGEDWEAYINWLKSLRPLKRWKPSDEQMEALDWQIENTSVGSWQYKATKELLADLKKLKEE